jgi:hypothetical protein
MTTRVKMWLGYPAVIVWVLGSADLVYYTSTGTSPVSLLIAGPLTLLAGGYLVFAFLVPAIFGRSVPRQLPPAGPVIAVGKCEGRLGGLRVTGRSIRVSVYSDRLTLRIFPMGEYTVHGSEIRNVSRTERFWGYEIAIEHTGPGHVSPVVLKNPGELAAVIARIDRRPLELPAQPVADAPTAEAARNVVWIFESISCALGIAGGLVTLGWGVIDVAAEPDLFGAVVAGTGGVGAYLCARVLIKQLRHG